VRRPTRFAACLTVVGAVSLAPSPGRSQEYGGGAQGAPAEQPAQPKVKEKEKEHRGRWGRREDKPDGGWGKAATVRERTGRRIAEAYEHYQADRYDEAEAALQKLRPQSLNELELAKYHQIHALVSYGRKDMNGAREHLRGALAQNALEPDEQAQIHFQIAQLYLQEERWEDVVKELDAWFALLEQPPPHGYYLMALAHYQNQDLNAALGPAQKAVDGADQPQESRLQLLLAIRLTNREYKEAEPVLRTLVTRYPDKKIYWTQLSTLYGALGDFDKALVFLQLSNNQGMLTQDSELRRLAQLQLAQDLPYPAAQLLTKSLEAQSLEANANAFELLSTAWIQARDFDKALEPLERAADLSTDGKLYVRLAQVHLQREEWSQAEAALREALDRGGLDNVGEPQLLMGITFYSQKRPDQALPWFARARAHAETREEAETWVKHIEQQLPSS
jgi:tetratricopeptide (TPR) repeat protein